MEKKNIRTITVLALAVAFVLAIVAMSLTFFTAGAESTVSATSVFTTTGSASSLSDKGVLTYSMGDSEGGDAVTYRRNLALKWYSVDEDSAEGAVAGEVQYLSLTLGFTEVNFTEFKVALESSQLSMDKAGKTTNELTFAPDGAGGLKVSVNGTESAVTVAAADLGEVVISLGEKAGEEGSGTFAVSVNGAEAGKFANIGKNYAKYSSATSTTPLTPLTFTVQSENAVEFAIAQLNGQSFALNEDGKITDNTPPVLVIDSEIKRFVLGSTFSFETVSIDVCSSSVTSTKYYLANAQASDVVLKDGKVDTEAYTLWSSSSKYFFDNDFEDTDGNVPDELSVSVAVNLSDGNSNSAVALVEWYGAYATAYGIPVVRPENTADRPVTSFYDITYDADGTTVTDVAENAADVGAYRAAVTAATKDEEGEQIRVGSGAYYYIPSLKAYISDATCGYTDMEFVVYYRTGSSSTSSSTYDYDGLKIEVSKEGTYQFCVVPKNSSGKAMLGVFEDGNGYREAEITSENVWEALNVATFSFEVTYYGPSVEAPTGEPDIGYVDVTYTFDSFETMATSNSREQYTLYVLNLNSGVEMTLAEVRKAETDGKIAADAEGASADGMVGYWTKIEAYDSELEAEEGDNAYNWNPTSSLTFVPQSIGFYKVVMQVADGNYPVASASQIVNISADADIVPGITQWLSNNWMSVLFLCVGGACLIAIVVILLVKPKSKAPAAAEGEAKESIKDKRKNRK